MPRVPHAPLFDEPSPENIASLLEIVSDPALLRMLDVLAEGETRVEVPCREAGDRIAAASYHISLLRATGLIESRRDGARMFHSLTAKARLLSEAAAILARIGNGRGEER